MSEPSHGLGRSEGAAPTGRSDTGRWWEGRGVLGLAVILVLYLVLAVSSAQQKSITVDELGHLPSGFYYLKTGDPRYSSLNPPLINSLSALPAILLERSGAAAPPATDGPISFWSTGYHFLTTHRADYLRIYSASRWIPVSTVAVLGILLFAWARRLAPEAGTAAGLLAAGFVLLSPNVLAHARLIGTDTGTAFFLALSLWSFRGMLRRPSVHTAALCGVTLGLAQLTKFYALLLYPTLLIVTIGWHRLSPIPRPALGRLLGCLAAAGGVSLLVLNTGYLWNEFGASLSDLSLRSDTGLRWAATALGSLPLPLPGAYLRAFDGQLAEIDSGIPSFLFGETFTGGRWYYFAAVLAIKTPLPLLLAFGLAASLSASRTRLPARESLLLAAFPILLLTVLSLSERRQLGARALLGAVPFVQVWVAATVARSWPRRWPIALAGAALASLAIVSMRSYPDYLSYFNAFAGGNERGYRYASDANVDIGQDLVGLADYLERQGVDEVQLLYFGSVDPGLYGIDYAVPVAGELRPGLLAVSVSLYRMGYPTFDHGELRMVGPVEVAGEPVASIGDSIHVYRLPPRPE
jgi:hypothetical protein